jgi:hypothetical protein
MKKVLFLSEIRRDAMMLSYFKPYQVSRGYDDITKYNFNTPIKCWIETNEKSLENIEGFYKFLYKDIEIDYKFINGLDNRLSYFEEIGNNEINLNNYDKVFIFKRIFFAPNFNQTEWELTDKTKFEVIFLNVNEAFHDSDENILTFLNNNKVISGGNFFHKHENLLYEPFLNLLYFYYIDSYEHLTYNYLDVKKNNLLGMYLRKNYKAERDERYNILREQFSQKNIDEKLIQIYKAETIKPDYIKELIRIHTPSGWEGNSISSYTDYITSVCAYMFETTNHKTYTWPSGTLRREYLTEKTLKSLLYSKLNIPFIIDINPYKFLILHELGFWFLNSEFFNFNDIADEQSMSNNYNNSITESINLIIQLFEKNDKDLDKTHKEIELLYGSKMQNNFTQLMSYLEAPKNHNELLNFILDDNNIV